MFRTEVEISKTDLNLAHTNHVLTIGSCFAEVMGGKLKQHKVNALVNPFGTIFNPESVCRLLQAALNSDYDFEQHLLQRNGIWCAYDLHSSLSSPDKDQLLIQIEDRLKETRRYLQNASLLIITLGTSIAYQLKETGNVVANCHKLPANNFNRILLDLQHIRAYFNDTLAQIKSINPGLKVLLTVSPVRHVKETLTLNSVSKSELRLLCHYMQQDQQDVLYFPAYEIMMDDLRDYRYYKDDMLHPTSLAENYIWDKFVKAYYNEEFQKFVPEWEKMSRAISHKPFHPASEAHQAFLRNTLSQLQHLAHKYKIDVTEEQHALEQQILTH